MLMRVKIQDKPLLENIPDVSMKLNWSKLTQRDIVRYEQHTLHSLAQMPACVANCIADGCHCISENIVPSA